MIRANTSKSSELPAPDLTPLLDIIFIVMVFLLLTASVHLNTLNLQLPQTKQKILKPASSQSLVINISEGKKPWALDGMSYQHWDTFSQQLLSKVKSQPKRPLVIGADKQTTVDKMLKLLAFLQAHNIKTSQLLMDKQHA
ncbi:ExbD/TolR family protein [Dongshaea marina]|uniref:ExbD/TolR family protein n=1 Tax=Dongshaea marina TaxID=2047966 RepID=UPI000D3E3BE5|nr:biopolymer transporter ExbD [Dongshaea marina]